jgi:type IV pilus assembly protein PilV
MLINMKRKVTLAKRSEGLTRTRIRGVSLIEVMISIVLSSFALLALAAVNSSSIRYTKMSQYRAIAAQLSNDIGERMRANKAAATTTPSSYQFETNFAGQATAPALPTGNDLCNTKLCSKEKIAALDLAQWRVSVRDMLPEGSVVLKYISASSAMEVWIAWRDPVVANTDESPANASECPDSLSKGSDNSIRCSYFRVTL